MGLDLLRQCFTRQRRHASPFLVLGDPDPETSIQLAVDAVAAGATMLELGVPYRDACADGPAVQEAFARAGSAGVDPAVALEVMRGIHANCPGVPLNLLVYGNLVHAAGEQRFCAQWSAAGAASLLVPDIPRESAGPLRAACAAHGLGHVVLTGPATPKERLRLLANDATGFLYSAAVQGVTGSGGVSTSMAGLDHAVATGVPVCAGFGLSHPDHMLAAFRAGAQIAVVGSHLLRAIGAAGPGRSGVREAFREAWGPFAAAVPRQEAVSPQDGQDRGFTMVPRN